jgi:hypothetical protein
LRTIQRIWRAHRVEPHRVRTFKRSNDPVRIPTKPAGDSDLKPAVIPRRSRPPF